MPDSVWLVVLAVYSSLMASSNSGGSKGRTNSHGSAGSRGSRTPPSSGEKKGQGDFSTAGIGAKPKAARPSDRLNPKTVDHVSVQWCFAFSSLYFIINIWELERLRNVTSMQIAVHGKKEKERVVGGWLKHFLVLLYEMCRHELALSVSLSLRTELQFLIWWECIYTVSVVST